MSITKADLLELIDEGPAGPVSRDMVNDTGCNIHTPSDPFGEGVHTYREAYHLILENRTVRHMKGVYSAKLKEELAKQELHVKQDVLRKLQLDY